MPTRRQLSDDLKEVAERFLAYRWAMEHAEGERSGELIAYVTAGGSADARAEALASLANCAHRVVDTQDAGPRAKLLRQIRRLGAESDPPTLLPEAK